jgi:hypothetical protein
MSLNKQKNVKNIYRGINEFKKGNQPRTNIVKDENGDLLADSHNILNRWKNYFCQPLNVHGVNHVMQTDMNIAEPLVSESSTSETETAIKRLKRYKL